jgi:CheY-like chemotaxis protein
MSMRVLWVDDEYNRYPYLISGLENKGVVFDFAGSLIAARKKLDVIEEYNAIIMDIILPMGRDYSESDAAAMEQKPVYLGLVFLEELISLKKPVPKVVILTIVEDPRVLVQIRTMGRHKKIISDILRKGQLQERDVYEAVSEALNKQI